MKTLELKVVIELSDKNAKKKSVINFIEKTEKEFFNFKKDELEKDICEDLGLSYKDITAKASIIMK